MKKLSFINKIIFIINNVFALSLILTFFLPYIKPSSIATAPVIGLFTPALILINALFVCYWIIFGLKKQFFLSFLVLFIGYFIAPSFYKFSSTNKKSDKQQLSVLSYNVRKFNMYKWIEDKHLLEKINSFIKKENPDIITFQEFKKNSKLTLNYPYKHIHRSYNWNKEFSYPSGLAFFSKYPIIDTGAVKYKKVFTSIAYIDILKNKDTIRVYNFHLESLGVNPGQEYFGHKDSEGFIKKLRKSFKVQEVEIDTLNHHLKKHKLKTIITGDMNNTPYSWAYRNLKGDLQDTFVEAGKGFGKTYNFKGFPLRIDYIFADPNFEVLQHKNYNIKYSDHFPIMATLSF